MNQPSDQDPRVHVVYYGTESRFSQFVGSALLGGVLVTGLYILIGLSLETLLIPHLEPPKYSYGVLFVITLPIAMFVGVLTGIGFACYQRGQRQVAVGTWAATSILGAFATFLCWRDDGIGECTSEIVLYSPLVGICGAILVLSIVVRINSLKDATDAGQRPR